jgi:hypothetical protein
VGRHLLNGHLNGPDGEPPLPGLAQLWRLDQGEHPTLPEAVALMNLMPVVPEPARLAALAAADLPLAFAHSGHHLCADHAYLAAAGGDDLWPIAPVYVRDLAGRVLHTGLAPQPVPPGVPLTPASCLALTPAQAAPLEKIFLVHLRRLELNPTPGTPLSGHPQKCARALYPAPQRYPYKLRVDSFYQDGFRLPQLTRLHVQPTEAATAEAAARAFTARWQDRPIDQPYEVFYEAQNGADWYEQLFRQGCTIIPTLEAYNGWFQVTPEFGMADVWPGRAVAGLHQVVGEEAAASPPGTILRVIEPGFATRHAITPAQVVVSNGQGYRPPPATAPLLPDLRLPHPRVGGAGWGAVWLPTAPAHFIQPALWDWNPAGDFVQLSGPLWDPLHYVYASTLQILKALRRPLAEAPWLAEVPEAMQPRFHPVTGLTGYDTVNRRTGAERRRSYAAASPLAASDLDHVALGREVAGVGYHPLPAALEYELDPAARPQLGPARFGACPPDLGDRLAPVIVSTVTPEEARRLTVVGADPVHQVLLNPRLYPAGFDDADRDYPQLQRFTLGPPPLVELARSLPVFLPELSPTQLFQNLKRVFGNRATLATLAAVSPGLKDVLQPFREAALAWRRRRYRLWRKAPAYYAQLWAAAEPLAEPAGVTLLDQNAAILAAILGQFGIQTLPRQGSKVKSSPDVPTKQTESPHG